MFNSFYFINIKNVDTEKILMVLTKFLTTIYSVCDTICMTLDVKESFQVTLKFPNS